MPTIYEKAKTRIGKENDKRIKVTDAMVAEMEKMYASGMSQRAIAAHFKVDKRTVGWKLNPEAYKNWQANRVKEKPWLKYYDKDRHKEYIKNYRKRLQMKHNNKLK